MLDQQLWKYPEEAAKKLAPVFKAMEWVWTDRNRVPTEQEIAVFFEQLEHDMKGACITSGHLLVVCLDNGVPFYGLESAYHPISPEE